MQANTTCRHLPATTEQEAPKFVAISQHQAMEIHLLGRALYGSLREWDQRRPTLILHYTQNRSSHTNYLSTVEAAKFIAAMEREIRKRYTEQAGPLAEYPILLEQVDQLRGRPLAEAFNRLRARLTSEAIPNLASLDEITA